MTLGHVCLRHAHRTLWPLDFSPLVLDAFLVPSGVLEAPPTTL